jgi:hypothetical protein
MSRIAAAREIADLEDCLTSAVSGDGAGQCLVIHGGTSR